MQFEHGYALLIGVGEHASVPRLSLPVTVKDVSALHKTLLEPDLCAYPKDHIQLLLNKDATNSAIIAGLNGLKAHAVADPQSTVLIYYSGHGWVSPDGDYCLVTQDTTPGAVADTALRAATLTSVLRGIQAERVLIVLDCCHAEGMAEAKNFENVDDELAKGIGQGEQATQSLVQSLAQGTGRAVFCSSQGNEKSYFYRDETLSVFTYHFIEALQGAGHAPGETAVTIASLMKYVAAAVPTTVDRLYGKSQHPFFKFETTDFPVALIRGGKGLPSGGWESVRPRAEEYLAQFTQPVTLTSSGAIAQGAGAVAVGRGGVYVGGNSTGNINTGTQIAGDYVRGDKVLGDKIAKLINTGGGAFFGGKVTVDGGTLVGRDSVEREPAPRRLTREGRALSQLLGEHFAADELERLAAELGFSSEDLSGVDRAARAESLVMQCEERGRSAELKRFVRWVRPNLSELLA